MRTIILLTAIGAACTACAAQMPLSAPERTAAPAESRFEIIQITLLTNMTLKLDKKTGATSVLGGNVVLAGNPVVPRGQWVTIERGKHPHDKADAVKTVNYQIVSSANNDTYLLNVATGATWRLALNAKNERCVWEPTAEEGAVEAQEK